MRKVAERAGVIAAAVAQGQGVVLLKPGDQGEILAEGREGFECDRELIIGPEAGGGEVGDIDAVGRVDHSHASRECRSRVTRGGGRTADRRQHGVKHGRRHGDAESTQKCPTSNFPRSGHNFLPRPIKSTQCD